MTSSGISWGEALAMAGGISGFFVACLIFLSRRIVQMHDDKIIEITKNVEKLGERVDLCETTMSAGTAKILLKQHEWSLYVEDGFIKKAETYRLFAEMKTDLRAAHEAQNKKIDYIILKLDQLFERDHSSRSSDA